MKSPIYVFYVAACLLMATSAPLAAVDPAAAVVEVRKSCTENGVVIDNCFTDLTSLTSWIENTRKPNAASPLQVNIGPGTFQSQTTTPNGNIRIGMAPALSLICYADNNYTGYISFIGAGTGQTVLTTSATGSALTVSDCTGMDFSQLTINGPLYTGILWSGGGTSKWSSVDVIAAGRGWYESGCAETKGSHYWVGSNIRVTEAISVAVGYRATCDESWFFGSEISATIAAGDSATETGAVLAREAGIIHVYGSVLRVFADGTGEIPAANADGGEIHIHGTGIDVTSSVGNNIVALRATSGGMIHANETAYNMSTTGGTGTITRISNLGGHIHAPYMWAAHPEAPNIISTHGNDTAVVTNTTDGQPHIVIYSDACASKWFDSTTSSCR